MGFATGDSRNAGVLGDPGALQRGSPFKSKSKSRCKGVIVPFIYLLIYSSSATPAPRPPSQNTVVANCRGEAQGLPEAGASARSWGRRLPQGMRERSRVLGQRWGGGMASWVPACPHGSLHVPAGPCMSLCSLDPSSSPCSGGTRGMLSPMGGCARTPFCRGGERTVVAEDQSVPCPGWGWGGMREGCGAAANYRRCPSCGIDRGSRTGRRPTFPAGLLGNEPGHRGSRLPRQPGGYLGQG